MTNKKKFIEVYKNHTVICVEMWWVMPAHILNDKL